MRFLTGSQEHQLVWICDPFTHSWSKFHVSAEFILVSSYKREKNSTNELIFKAYVLMISIGAGQWKVGVIVCACKAF